MTKVDGYRRTGRRLHAGPGLLRHHRAGQLRHGDVVDERHGNRRSACRRRRRLNGRSGSTRPRMRGGQCPGTRTSRQLRDRRRDGSPAPGSACSATPTPTAPGHLGRATDRRPERHSDPQATGSWAYRYDVRHEYRRFHLARIGRSHVSGAASDKTSWMFPHLSVGRFYMPCTHMRCEVYERVKSVFEIIAQPNRRDIEPVAECAQSALPRLQGRS